MNPYASWLEFVVYHPLGYLYFYRVSSVFTLQTLQVEELLPLCADKLSLLSSACYVQLQQEQEVLLVLGSENGSLLLLDCRSACILLACLSLLPRTPILALSFVPASSLPDTLVLATPSSLLTLFRLPAGINSLLADQPPHTVTLDG